MTNQRPIPSTNRDPYGRLLLVLIGVLSLMTLGILGLALSRAGYLPGISSLLNPTATPAGGTGFLSCQELIERAMLLTGNNCDHIGPNQVCYGNIAVQADLIPDANERFANAGDVVDVQKIERLSTAPLDLSKQEWGIAVLNLIANLPRSLPGESVKMVVFGNTTLGNNDVNDVQSFYFFSELGRIFCDKVPFDGLMITMPDGTGINLLINGSELTLMGDASLRAVQNGTMDVSLYSGTASITANNQTQNFTAGQTVSVPLGGDNGTESVGVPSEPTSLTTEEVNLACSLTGLFCPVATSIPSVVPQATQVIISSPVNGTSIPGSTPLPTAPATGVSPATPIPPQPTQQIQATQKPKNTPPGLEKKTPRPEPTNQKNNGNNQTP